MKIRVYYHHTDCGGVVYYATYLKFLEEARTEFFDERSISIKKLKEGDVQFAVYHQEIDYKSPVFYADVLQIDTVLTKVSRTALEFEYIIKNQAKQTVCTAKTTMACLGSNFKPRRIPPEVINKLTINKSDESKSLE